MPYLGDLFIFSAAACSIISLVLYLLAWRGKVNLLNLARNFFVMTTMFLFLAIFDLLYLILTNDFSVAYVYAYSSSDLPLGYLIASLWGGQEGTFLLWIVFASGLGLIMMYTSKAYEKGNMFFLNLFLISILAILFKKSPFELLPVAQAEGAGLNPLLQNFWMTIHPPIMFLGFAGTVFPFCFAMTALVEKKYNSWIESARRWTIFAWASLGISLIMGGYWAYKTLGWGGFWAWDPVENSSFIPWIFLTTQIHAMFIKRQRKGLLRFSLFIASLTFWSVLYGTFLTRSGVLADFSVHSFVDLGINQFLISGMLMFVFLGSFMLLFRWNDIAPEPSFSKINSRSYIVTIGIVILFIGGILVLLGTSAPILTRLTDSPSNVGLSYYFSTMTPIAVAILFLISIFPAFKWKEGISKPFILILGGSGALLTMITLLVTGVTDELIYLLFFGFSCSALLANGYVIYDTILKKRQIQPGYISHIGLTLLLIGAAVSAGFEVKQQVTLPMNEMVEVMDYQMKFVKIDNNAKGFDCHVEVLGESVNFTGILPHEFPKNSEGVMKKPHVEKFVSYDLYLSPIAFQPPENEDASIITIQKEETLKFDKYEITFHDFDMNGHDGDSGPGRVDANLTVSYNGKTENIVPYLQVTDLGVEPVPARFDYDNAAIFIAGVNPEDGSVVLKIDGNFVPSADTQDAVLVIEVSEKPLIGLFWLGNIILFSSGIWSTFNRKRKKKLLPQETFSKKNIIERETVSS